MADDDNQVDEGAAAPETPEAEAAAVSEEPATPAKRTRAKKSADPVADEGGEPGEQEAAAVAEQAAPAAEDAPVAEPAAAAADEAAPAADAAAPGAEEVADEPAAKPARAARAKKAADPADGAATPKRTPRAKPLKKEARPKERKPHVREPRPLPVEGRRKERRGIVVSASMDKTITIRIDSAKPHPKYHKIVRRSTRLHVHDERNEAGVGDVVRIVETRPLSKLKRWRMVEIVEKAK
jgi:small subunit ribosomal protein S17